MNKKVLILSLIALLVACGQTGKQPSATAINAAHPSRLDSVITKFRNDNRSYEEFILLGKMECYSNVTGMEKTVNDMSELYFSMYANLYNSLAPFTRLLNEQSIKANIDEYLSSNKTFNSKVEKDDKNKSGYYQQIKLCDCLFDKNDNYKMQYIKLINNKDNYITPANSTGSFSREEIEQFQKDYLDNYFIKIITN
jgi:hypothetical protein